MRATRLRYFVHAGAPHGHRHLIVHRLMWASKIVKGHPRTYVSPRLAKNKEASMSDMKTGE
jgi:hypothetical protein